MPLSARITLLSGLLVLALTLFNAYEGIDVVTPSLQRAEVLSGLSAVGLMLISALWTRAIPQTAKRLDLQGEQIFKIKEDLSPQLKNELAWGSHLFLTATAASVILIYIDDIEILLRGISTKETFKPGAICKRAATTGKLISLVKLELYPGKDEFTRIVEGLPSVIVYALNNNGWVILGGSSERCFTKSDEVWFTGWCEKLKMFLNK